MTPESPRSPEARIADVRTSCLAEVETIIDDIYDPEKESLLAQHGYVLYGVIADRIKMEVAAGDIAKGNELFKKHIANAPLSAVTFMEACFVLAENGSVVAFNALHERLEAEQEQAKHEVAQTHATTPHNLFPSTNDWLLYAIVRKCGSLGISPHGYLERYAIDDLRKWKLETYYLTSLGTDHPERMPEVKEAIEARVREFLSTTFSPGARFHEAADLLSITQEPALQQEIFAAFARATDSTRITPFSFPKLLSFANCVINNPELATQQNIEYLASTVDFFAEKLAEADMDTFHLTDQQLGWRLALKLRDAADPAELIEYLDLQISQMLTSEGVTPTVTAEGNTLKNEQYIHGLHDSMLAHYAEQLAKKGDFTTAKKILDSVASEFFRNHTVAGILVANPSPKAVRAFKPDELTSEVYADTRMHFELLEAFYSEDPQVMLETITACAQDINPESTPLLTAIDNLHQKLTATNPEIAQSLTKYILDALRKKHDYKSALHNKLSDILIKAKDIDELNQRVASIREHSSNELFKMNALWRLAQKIA